jgi:uncharacterized membrane protein
MNLFAIALVIASTFMHASWNLMAKHGKSEHDFFERMQVMIILVGLIPFAISEYHARSIPSQAWIYAVLSGFSCGVYYFSLANAYSLSDFTTAYPVARALPVLLMGFIDTARGEMPTSIGWLGMVMVAVGCTFSPLESIKEIRLSKYINKASVWMVLTAFGTVGYSTFDKMASEIVKKGVWTAGRYGYIFYAFSGIFYIIIKRLFHRSDPDKKSLSGILGFGAYWLVLWAYQLVNRASYVVTFRQFSIVIGVIAAFIIYREKGFAIRMTAVLTITAGLIIITIWG